MIDCMDRHCKISAGLLFPQCDYDDDDDVIMVISWTVIARYQLVRFFLQCAETGLMIFLF